MPRENVSEQFIRLLTEAVEFDRSIRKTDVAARIKAGAGRFKQVALSYQVGFMLQPGPIDRAPDTRLPQYHEPWLI